VKKGELVLQKYANLICNLPERKRNSVMVQLVYPQQDTPLSKLASVLAALPNDVQMRLATNSLVAKRGDSFIKQSAEVLIWRGRIAQIPSMSPMEKKALWSALAPALGWLGTKALPWLGGQAGNIGKWLGGGGGTGGVMGQAGNWLSGSAAQKMTGWGRQAARKGLDVATQVAAMQPGMTPSGPDLAAGI